MCLQVQLALAERQQGRWPQPSQQEPFQALVMSRPEQLLGVAPLGAALPSQVCAATSFRTLTCDPFNSKSILPNLPEVHYLSLQRALAGWIRDMVRCQAEFG